MSPVRARLQITFVLLQVPQWRRTETRFGELEHDRWRIVNPGAVLLALACALGRRACGVPATGEPVAVAAALRAVRLAPASIRTALPGAGAHHVVRSASPAGSDSPA